MKLTSAWFTFVKERFEPLSTGLMLAVFTGAHIQVSQSFLTSSFELSTLTFTLIFTLILFLGVVAFFFKLRLFDEIKDYELDCQINPTRPLPRGLVTVPQVHVGILLCIVVELSCFASRGWGSFFSLIFVLCYSLLMYNEFFLKTFIRPHLTTYAVLHTASCGFLSLALLSFLKQRPLWELSTENLLFALACWCVFNVFEFGRKTFATEEERPNVESYSLVWGRFGAVVLVAVMVAIAGFCFAQTQALGNFAFRVVAGILLSTILISGGIYAALNSAKTAQFYRLACSLFIVLIFISILLLSQQN